MQKGCLNWFSCFGCSAHKHLTEEDVVHEIVGDAVKDILGDPTVSEFNHQYSVANSRTLPQRASAAEMMAYLNESNKSQAAAFVLGTIEQQSSW